MHALGQVVLSILQTCPMSFRSWGISGAETVGGDVHLELFSRMFFFFFLSSERYGNLPRTEYIEYGIVDLGLAREQCFALYWLDWQQNKAHRLEWLDQPLDN